MAGKKDPRSKLFRLRLTPTEFEDFRSRAAGRDMSMSDFARVAILQVKPETERRRRFVFHPVDPAMLRLAASIGNNLNQIAAWANIHKSGADTASVLVRLVAVERALSDLVEGLTHETPP